VSRGEQLTITQKAAGETLIGATGRVLACKLRRCANSSEFLCVLCDEGPPGL